MIRDLFRRLDGTERIGTFVEIGAADGVENCTRALVERGWPGVWIEGEPGLASRARSVVGERPVAVVNQYVDLDSIGELSRRWPDDLDLIVVDIDGNDYWVCDAALRRVRPRVLVVEYNGSFGPRTRWIARYNPTRRWDETADHGASLSALDLLARARGYRLVYCDESGTNAFFVRRDCAVSFPQTPARRLFQPPVHKLPNGHPVWRPVLSPTSPTTDGRDVGLELTWLESDVAEQGTPVYGVVTLTNRGKVLVGNARPAPTLVASAWAENVTPEPTRVSVSSWSLEPGSSIALPVRVVAPTTVGRRELCLAVVQEGVRWFDETIAAKLLIVARMGDPASGVRPAERYISRMRVSPLLDRLTGRARRQQTLDELRAIRERLDQVANVLFELNHDVRSGSPDVLPLFVGFAERVRTDAESAVAASVLIDRQLRILGAETAEQPPSTES